MNGTGKRISESPNQEQGDLYQCRFKVAGECHLPFNMSHGRRKVAFMRVFQFLSFSAEDLH